MSCSRAQEIDLPGFLADSRAAAFAEFRSHYPTCTDCAAEVAIWTELHTSLELGRGPHPGEETLLRFEDNVRLSRDERARVQRHLDRCPACRDEIASLRGFEPRAVAATGAVGVTEAPPLAAVPAAPERPRPRASAAPPPRRRGILARVLLHPAVAWALVGLLLYPALRGLFATGPDPVAASAPIPAETRGARVPAKAPGAVRATPPSTAEPGTRNAQPPGGELLEQAAQTPSAGTPSAEAPGAAQDTAAADVGRAAEVQPPAAEVGPAGAAATPETPAQTGALESLALTETESVLRLEPGVRTEIQRRTLARVLRIELPAPTSAERGRPLDVRLVSSERERELRERVVVPTDSEVLVMRVPASWIAAGDYEVELRALGPGAPFDPLARFRLVVR